MNERMITLKLQGVGFGGTRNVTWKMRFLNTNSINYITGVIRGLFEKKASKFCSTSWQILIKESEVKTAACGDKTTLSNEKNSLGTYGSFSNTSKPAPSIS